MSFDPELLKNRESKVVYSIIEPDKLQLCYDSERCLVKLTLTTKSIYSQGWFEIRLYREHVENSKISSLFHNKQTVLPNVLICSFPDSHMTIKRLDGLSNETGNETQVLLDDIKIGKLAMKDLQKKVNFVWCKDDKEEEAKEKKEEEEKEKEEEEEAKEKEEDKEEEEKEEKEEAKEKEEDKEEDKEEEDKEEEEEEAKEKEEEVPICMDPNGGGEEVYGSELWKMVKKE